MEEESHPTDDIHVCYWDDSDGNPHICVIRVDEQRQRTVDVVKSLERDPSNVGHPLIIAMIIECTDAIRFRRVERKASPIELFYPYTQSAERGYHPDQQTAERWLCNISAALVSGAKKRCKEDEEYRTALKTLQDFDDPYFEDLWKLLEDTIAKGVSASRKIEMLAAWQTERSQNDAGYYWLNQEVMEFVKEMFCPSSQSANDPLEFPKRGGGKALRNLFFAWKKHCDVPQAKNRISAANRYTKNLADDSNPYHAAMWDVFTEAEAQAFVERDLGINVVSRAVEEILDTSGLVVIESPLW